MASVDLYCSICLETTITFAIPCSAAYDAEMTHFTLNNERNTDFFCSAEGLTKTVPVLWEQTL